MVIGGRVKDTAPYTGEMGLIGPMGNPLCGSTGLAGPPAAFIRLSTQCGVALAESHAPLGTINVASQAFQSVYIHNAVDVSLFF